MQILQYNNLNFDIFQNQHIILQIKLHITKLLTNYTVGTAHKQNTIHGRETQPPVITNKPWVQPKKTFINIPEMPDLEKIKQHFTRTVTAEQSKAALDRLDK